MSNYRLGKDELIGTLGKWDKFIPGRIKIHLVACGGTALTLLGYKESTKDVDLMVPVKKEYDVLIRFLNDAGYQKVSDSGWMRSDEKTIYDLYKGNRVFTTELLSSPLDKGGNKKILELKKIYLGVLNPIDWIVTKMFRGSSVDIDDCAALARHQKIDLKKLEARFRETAQYDVSEERALKNLSLILKIIKKI